MLLYAAAPTLAIPTAAALVAWRPPQRRARSLLMHAATGGLIAVVAVELLGDLDQESPWALTAGVLLGVAFITALDAVTARLEEGGGAAESVGLLAVAAVDFAIDGLLLGVALAHDPALGLVLAIALAVEDFVTGLSVATTLSTAVGGRGMVARTSAAALGLPVGAVVGVLVGGALTGAAFTVLLSFAAVALLFLALEELLREAHRTGEPRGSTAALFLGLLAFLLIERVV